MIRNSRFYNKNAIFGEQYAAYQIAKWTQSEIGCNLSGVIVVRPNEDGLFMKNYFYSFSADNRFAKV